MLLMKLLKKIVQGIESWVGKSNPLLFSPFSNMAARQKKVLLKVIILGDSGWVFTTFFFSWSFSIICLLFNMYFCVCLKSLFSLLDMLWMWRSVGKTSLMVSAQCVQFGRWVSDIIALCVTVPAFFIAFGSFIELHCLASLCWRCFVRFTVVSRRTDIAKTSSASNTKPQSAQTLWQKKSLSMRVSWLCRCAFRCSFPVHSLTLDFVLSDLGHRRTGALPESGCIVLPRRWCDVCSYCLNLVYVQMLVCLFMTWRNARHLRTLSSGRCAFSVFSVLNQWRAQEDFLSTANPKNAEKFPFLLLGNKSDLASARVCYCLVHSS